MQLLVTVPHNNQCSALLAEETRTPCRQIITTTVSMSNLVHFDFEFRILTVDEKILSSISFSSPASAASSPQPLPRWPKGTQLNIREKRALSKNYGVVMKEELTWQKHKEHKYRHQNNLHPNIKQNKDFNFSPKRKTKTVPKLPREPSQAWTERNWEITHSAITLLVPPLWYLNETTLSCCKFTPWWKRNYEIPNPPVRFQWRGETDNTTGCERPLVSNNHCIYMVLGLLWVLCGKKEGKGGSRSSPSILQVHTHQK